MQFDLLADPDSEIDPDLIRFLRYVIVFNILVNSCFLLYELSCLMFVCRLKFISGKDSFILESVFYNSVFRTLEAPFSRPNELAVCEHLLTFCERSLEGMLAADQQYGEATDFQGRRGLISRLRQQVNGYSFYLFQLRYLFNICFYKEKVVLQVTINKITADITNIKV